MNALLERKDAAVRQDEEHGLQVAYEALAEALLNVPDEKVVADVVSVAEALGSAAFEGFAPSKGLAQRYYDRFFVPTSPLYLPLSEDRVAGAQTVDGRTEFGQLAGKATDHARACYEAAGFAYGQLQGFEPTVRSLRPDSLASELAFLAYVKQAAVRGDVPAETSDRLTCQFLRTHRPAWMEKAARLMAARDDDFYARVCRLAAEVCALDLEHASAQDAPKQP